MPKCFFSWHSRWSTCWISFWSLQIYKAFFLAMLAECVSMCEQLCQNDHSDPITRMPSRRSLVSVLPQVIRWTLCLHLFQVLADALRVNATIKELYLNGNPIGDEGVKVWWLQRGEFGGPSKSSRSNGSISIISVVPQFATVMSSEF